MKRKPAQHIQLKRVYDEPSGADGYRILVDRLWPRGIKKEKAELDEWVKDLAPSNQLRKWFDHDPERWEAFRKKYKAELKQNPLFDDFIKTIGKKKSITLLYATKHDQLTHAIILKGLIEDHHATEAE